MTSGDLYLVIFFIVTSHFGISIVTFKQLIFSKVHLLLDSLKTSSSAYKNLATLDAHHFSSACRCRCEVISSVKGITLVQAYCSFASILIYIFLVRVSHHCTLSLRRETGLRAIQHDTQLLMLHVAGIKPATFLSPSLLS